MENLGVVAGLHGVVERNAQAPSTGGWAGRAEALRWGKSHNGGSNDPRAFEPLLTLSERAQLAGARWLQGLPEALRTEIMGQCRVRNLRARECVQLAADGPALCGVASGTLGVRLRRPHSDILDYLPAGTWLVDGGRMAGARSLLMLEAHRRATVVTLPGELLMELARQHAGLVQPMLELSAGLIARLMEILEEHSALPLQQRVARWLLRLADRFGVAQEGCVRITLALNQTEMALMLRASRQRLNLALKSLEAAGILRVEKDLLLLDRAALVRVSAG